MRHFCLTTSVAASMLPLLQLMLFLLLALVTLAAADVPPALAAERELRRALIESLPLANDAETLDYFGQTHDGRPSSLPEPVRLAADTTPEAFDFYLRRGIPFVTNATLPPWTSDSLRSRFGDECVELFTFGEKHQTTLGAGEVALAAMRPTSGVRGLPALSNASLYFFPIDAPYRASAAGRALQAELPYPLPFLRHSEANARTFLGRLELFFSGPSTGAPAHTDQVCDHIASTQVEGSKRWRLTVLPDFNALRQSHGYEFNYTTDEETLYNVMIRQHALYDFELSTGDVVVFPSGMIHQTVVPADAIRHSLSYSVQFTEPLPVEYIAKYGNRIAYDLDGGAACLFDHFLPYALVTLDPNEIVDFEETTQENEDRFVSRGLTELFRRIDRTPRHPRRTDRRLDREDMLEAFTVLFKDVEYEMPPMEAAVNAFFAFNDRENKGFVTVEDVRATLKHLWTPDVAQNAHKFATEMTRLASLGEEYGQDEASQCEALEKAAKGVEGMYDSNIRHPYFASASNCENK